MKNLLKLLSLLFSFEIEDINFEEKKEPVPDSLITDYNPLYYPSCVVCLARMDLSGVVN